MSKDDADGSAQPLVAHKVIEQQEKEASRGKKKDADEKNQYWKTVARKRDPNIAMTKEQAQEEAHRRALRLHQELKRAEDYEKEQK